MRVEREALTATLSQLKQQGFTYLVKITAVDYVKSIDVLYFIRNLAENKDEVLEVGLDPADAHVPTALHLYRAADWYERELYEMFGIEVRGRPISRLLLEKWNGKGAPLRKAFAWSESYEKVEE